MTTKNAVVINLIKDNADILIKLKVAKEVEEFFKKIAEKQHGEDYMQTSTRWFDQNGQGLKFYKSSPNLDEKLRSYSVSNNFGDGLIDQSGRVNIALLRSVGASGEIVIKTNDLIGYDEVKVYIERIAEFTKVFYRNYLKKLNIKAKITFEF